MSYQTQKEIDELKKQIWFNMLHRDKCSLCGKEFGFNEDRYFGHSDDGSYAYTCKDCSQNLKDVRCYTNYKRCHNTIPDPKAKLWRYMDLAKFLSLLEDRELYFTRLDNFKDKFEGTLGLRKNEALWAANEKEWRKKIVKIENKASNLNTDELNLLNDQKFRVYRKNIKDLRLCNYVSCWHQSDCESEAMWQLYTRDSKQGIAIQTNFERLFFAMDYSPYASFGLVNYINFNDYNNGVSKNKFQPLDAPWYKRESFAHEKEFRIIIHEPNLGFPHEWEKRVGVDLKLLIENVYISPEADYWFVKLVRDIVINRYKIYLNICQSDLNDSPFY